MSKTIAAFLADAHSPLHRESATMFEDSLFDSQPQLCPSTRVWTATASILAQVIAAALLLLLPLLRPEHLPSRSTDHPIEFPATPVRLPALSRAKTVC